MGYLDFYEDLDCPAARVAVIRPCLVHAFAGGVSFDHMFMSAGEGLPALLARFHLVEVDGPIVSLRCSIDETTDVIGRSADTQRLAPPFIDLLDCALAYAGQYFAGRQVFDPREPLGLSGAFAEALASLGLIDHNGSGCRSFRPFLLDHGWIESRYAAISSKVWRQAVPDPFALQDAGTSRRFHKDAHDLLERITDRTLAAFPQELAPGWAEPDKAPSGLPWSVQQCWKFGECLPNKEGRLVYPHLLLNEQVARRIWLRQRAD